MSDTIAAIATPQLPSAIGILRLSGPGTLTALDRVFRAKNGRSAGAQTPRRMVYGDLLDADGSVIDNVLCVRFPGPDSYTGEDCAELHCHGSPVVLNAGLTALFAAGCRQAKGGEFTRRAFLNGQMDLTQAEAVIDLIDAETADAAANGATAIIAERELDVEIPTLVVKDSLKAFQRIAKMHRLRFEHPVVGITGSCGKTSTKEMLAKLTAWKNPLITEKNFNNEIGVPLTLTRIDLRQNQLAIVEAGVGAPDQMRELATMIEPDIAIITNVGLSHLERFEQVGNVAKEKAVLPAHAADGGWCLMHHNLLGWKAFDELKCKKAIVAPADAPEFKADLVFRYAVSDIENDFAAIDMCIEGGDEYYFEVPQMTKGMLENALLAIAGDDTRHARIGLGRALGDGAAEKMTAHGLDHGIAIDRRGEARSHGNNDRRHIARGTQVALGQNRVDHGSGFKLIEHLGLGVYHDGDVSGLGNCKRLCRRLRQASANALDLDLAQANGLAKTDCAADARGNRDIGHNDRHAGAYQASGDARGDIAGAANINEHSRDTSLCYGLSRAKAVRPLL